MSKKSIYGINFFEMNFGEAIAEKVLCDYKIIGMGVRHDELKRAIDTRKYIKDGITIDELINNYALNKVMERYGLTHAVTFHSRINWAKQFKNRHSEIFGKYQAYHVNGGQSTNERAEIFRAYKNNPKAIITNAQCLTEGVNIPIIDCLSRDVWTESQTTLSILDRKMNIQNAFSLKVNIQNANYLIIDDVITTGSTANECAKIIKENSNSKVGVFTIAAAE